MPADLRHSVFGGLHDGGAGDDVGAAVIHFDFGEQAEADGTDVHPGRLAGDAERGLAELIVGTDTRSKSGFLDGAKTGCSAPVSMPGIGDAAMHCRVTDKTFTTVVAVAKNSHGQLRTAQLYLVPDGSDYGCAKLGMLLADRL